MKIAVIYYTKNGVTRECAEKLRDLMVPRHEVTLFDVRTESPSPDGFDVIVLGSCVRMGRFGKELRTCLERNKAAISQKPSAFFICSGFPNNFEEYASTLLPKDIRFSLGIHNFGGELKADKLRGFDKFIVKMVRNSIKTRDFEENDTNPTSLPEILPGNISLLAEKIKTLKL